MCARTTGKPSGQPLNRLDWLRFKPALTRKRLRAVVHKIQAAATEEEAARYEDELVEAIFGPQRERRA